MTRFEVLKKVRTILDDLVQREIERRDYDHDDEVFMRTRLERWKEQQLREIGVEMDALVRSMLH